ncbi:MAG TPA: carboxypeptidase-like regulatory domain-containing protein, partial [Gemmataceae bacterium]
PALIAVQAIEGEFTRARLGDEQSDSRLIGGLVPVPLALDNFHAVVPVSPDANDPKSLTVEIALDPGRSVGGEVVDPDGKPLGGVTVAGLTAVKKTSDRATDTLAGPEFTAVGLEPEHPRTLVFLREEKRLAKAVTLRGDEKGPLTVRLEPLGALTGRLADRESRPVAGVQVRLSPARSLEPTLPGELVIGGIGTLRGAVKIAPVKTDEQGRFRFGGLIPGMKYELQAAGRELKGTRLADLLTDRGRPGVVNLLGRELTATPGKEVDLGDVPPKPSGE